MDDVAPQRATESMSGQHSGTQKLPKLLMTGFLEVLCLECLEFNS